MTRMTVLGSEARFNEEDDVKWSKARFMTRMTVKGNMTKMI